MAPAMFNATHVDQRSIASLGCLSEKTFHQLSALWVNFNS